MGRGARMVRRSAERTRSGGCLIHSPGGTLVQVAVFLHNRIRDAGAVTHLVDTHARESHWLDFKGGFWADEAKRPKGRGSRQGRGRICQRWGWRPRARRRL